MRNKKFSFSFKGKGYYIALILCAVAIGITGYLYYRNTNEPAISLQEPANQDKPSGDDVAVNVTTPNGTPTEPGTQTPTEKGEKPRVITRPVSGDTVMEYAMEVLSYNPTTRDWRVHNGIDIAAEAGAAVMAAADGTVYTVYEDETMGTTVVIRHDGGYVTKYCSLAPEVKVTAGQTVASGQIIGSVGCTALLETAIGDHLHFSVTCYGEDIDPSEFLSQK
jgi:murein DD-endopeptidase MepM/ murein hydrolase activator NlpD